MKAKVYFIAVAVFVGTVTVANAHARAVEIDFSNLSYGAFYPSPLVYSDATFTTFDSNYGFSGFGGLGTIYRGTSVSVPFHIAFASPISELKFRVDNQYATGELGFALAYDDKGNRIGSRDFVFHNLYYSEGIKVGFGALSGISSVDIYQFNADPGASLNFAYFKFDVLDVPTPEPAVFALFGLGVIALGACRRTLI